MRAFILILAQSFGFTVLALAYATQEKLTLSGKILSVALALSAGVGIVCAVVMAWKLK